MHFDPASSEFQRNPYPVYARLRAETPLLWHAPTRLWYVSAYEDVAVLLRERRLGRSLPGEQPALQGSPELAPFQRLSDHSLFDKEPPQHTRLRGLVSRVFTPQRVESLRPAVQSAARRLLAQAVQAGVFDLLEDLAVPLSVSVIADLLGVPEADRSRLRPWSAAIIAMYELSHTPAQQEQAAQASIEFWDYLSWLVGQRRRQPQDDLISALAAVADAETGARLTQDELVANCILLLNAGHEATVNGFGNGMYALFKHSQQHDLLRAAPGASLIRSSVEEMLRYDSPLQLFKRWVREDFEYKGIQLHQGQQIALFFGSANRDPARFEEPDKLLLTRQDNPHLSFGAGIHYCLGAPLARLELQAALEAVVMQTGRLQLVEEPQWRDSYVIRGLKSLRVVAEAPGRM